MRLPRLVLGALLMMASVAIVASSPTVGVASDPVSPGPPACPPNGQPGDLGCPIDNGGSIDGSGNFLPGNTITFQRSMPVGPCATAESTNCYNRFTNPSIAGCVQMDGPTSSDFETCHPFVNNEILESSQWVRPGTTSSSLACNAQFNETLYTGGDFNNTFGQIAAERLTCDVQMRTNWRQIPRLDGPTWLAWSFQYDVCEVAGEREFGNGFGCLQSRREGAMTWIRLDMPQRLFPSAGCEATVLTTETIPAQISVTDTSTIDPSLGDTLETTLSWPGVNTTEGSATFEADYPGTVPISVKAEAPISYSENSARCDVFLPHPQLGGEMVVTEVGDNGSAPGAEYDVSVVFGAREFGFRDIVLDRPPVLYFLSGDGQVLSGPTPNPVDQRLGWGDDDIEVSARVRTNDDGPAQLVFVQSGEDENGRRLVGEVRLFATLGGGPVRILDTRDEGTTFDGRFEAIGARSAGSVTPVEVTGRVDGGADSTGAFFSLSAIDPDAAGNATLYPCDGDRPSTPSLAFTNGSASATSVPVRLSASGEVCLHTSIGSEYTLDFDGWTDVPADADPDPDPEPDPPAEVSPVVPVSPARLVDTRDGQQTADGQLAGEGRVGAGQVLRVPVWGRGGVPEGATSVVVNTVAVSPDGIGFLTLFPCDGERPLTSNVNYGFRPVDVNNALVKLSGAGELCVYSEAATHLVMDVTAFSNGDEALVPKRLAESRSGKETDDGEQAGFGRVAAGSVTEVQVAGRGGVPTDAAAVAVNVTAVRPAAGGFLTLFPCGGEVPNASNLNYTAGSIRPNSAIVALSSDGKLCVFSFAATDLIVDVTASFASVPSFSPLPPARLVDSRTGQKTIDGEMAGFGQVAAGSVTTVQVAGRGGVPADAAAVALNVTAIRPAGGGFFTLYPCDEEVPTASSGNFVAGDVIANSGVVKLAADGSVCVFASDSTHLAIDVNAAWTSSVR